MNVNVNHNEPPLTTLVDQWQVLKQKEEDARAARVAHEAIMLPYLEQVPQGSKTTTLSDGRKVTVKNGDSYSVDWQAWKQVKDSIPDELKPVKLKVVLSEIKAPVPPKKPKKAAYRKCERVGFGHRCGN